ncbi:MAG: methylated-DNA--[protein]-cysteine S-methyltransferase [Chloroflexi bacterium]|nr:methylated-DNA--[protein]-cysteine S-methyltransferase [Chloroflexota bacterium]
MNAGTSDYARIEKAIQFIEQNFQEQPDLAAIADCVGLSEYHFQRLFTRWAGTSPKRFVQFLTINYAKQLLAESKSLLETTYETGLSSPGRLHDLFVTHEAITPGEFKRQGAGMTIAYGFHATPFGDCLLAMTERGICNLLFVAGSRQSVYQNFAENWAGARLVEDGAQTRPFIEQIFTSTTNKRFHLLLKGTNFQIQVWQALLQIPAGTAVSYGNVAHIMKNSRAVRAVGTAVGRNPVAFLIPCHRVLRQTGGFGAYRWGATRKKAILGWEAARRFPQAPSAFPV